MKMTIACLLVGIFAAGASSSMLTFVDSDGKDCTVESYKGTLYSTCLQSSFKPELVVENAQMMISLNKLTARVTDLESSLTARVTDLEKLTTEHTTDIAENTDAHIQNAVDIAANTGAHKANAVNISTNTDAHGTNVDTIAANTAAHEANAENIGTNTAAHGTNADNIAANTDAHGANAENIGTNTDAHEANADNIAANTAAHGTNADNIGTNTDAHGINADNIAANTDAHGTNADNIAAITDAPVDSCEDLRMRGITTSGVHPLNTANGIVNTKCLYQNGRMWTLAYKIGTGSGMKTTGSENLAALVTNSNTDDSGKLSDSDIKRLCAGQYYMKQSGITNANFGSLYCKFDDINTFADNKIVNKKCALAYSATGAYTQSYNSASWAWNFGSFDHQGAIITQLNYRDARLGSYLCQSCTTGDASCGNGGCDVEVYCLE